MVHAAIEVEFGPHWVDVQMMCLTGVSILVTAFLGLMAWLNGHKATLIAQDSSDREEARVLREVRDTAAAAVVKAIFALEMAGATDKDHPGTELAKDATREANQANLEARVQIELLPPSDDPVRFHAWFEETWKTLDALGKQPGDNTRFVNLYRGQAVGDVRRWRHRLVSVSDFANPGRPLVIKNQR